MSVSESRSAAKTNLDELGNLLRGAGAEPESAHDALVELARRLAPLHSPPYPQAVSEQGRPDTELTTQPLETAKLPPSNSEASNAPSNTAFVEKLARRLALLHSPPYPQAVSEHGRTETELTTQPLETAKLPPSNSEASNAPSNTAFVEKLARRLALLHSSPYPQAVSEQGRPDTELTTQPLETAKLPPSNSEASNAPSKTAFVEKLARRLAPRYSSPYSQAVSEQGRTDTELTTQPLETAKLPPSNSEVSDAPSKTAFVDVGAKQAFEFEDPYSHDPKQGRSGSWKLKVSALALAGLAIIGAVFALKGGVPSLPKAASFIVEAQGPAKMQPPSDRTVATSSDTGAIIPKQGIQEARDEVLSPGQPKGLNAEVSEESTPSVDFGSATAGPAQPTIGASGGTPMPAPVSTPGTGLPTAAPPPTASQFPDLNAERTLSLRPDGMSMATATPSATASGEAARTSGVSRPRAKPAPKAAIETAEIGERSTPKLDLRTRPFAGPPARVVAANIDTAAPIPTQETSSQLVHLGAPVNSEKAANALKPPQTAATPQAPLAPGQPVNPLVRALGDSIGALTARTGGAQRPVDQIATTPSGGWAVQLAAPKSESEAQSDVVQLNAKYASALSGATITVHEAQIYGATFYRVRVQGQSKIDAAALCERLKRDGGDCFIAK